MVKSIFLQDGEEILVDDEESSQELINEAVNLLVKSK